MSLRKLMMGAATAGALSFGLALAATPAAAATVVHVGTGSPTGTGPYFDLTGGSTPTSPVITALFGANLTGAGTPFDYDFQFTIPQNGLGSGNLSTSFAAPNAKLDITSVVINGTTYTPGTSGANFSFTNTSSGESLTVNGIKITSGDLNHVEVIGHTIGASSAFSGNATFVAVPEPATWLMMIGGLGMAGAMMRRRRNAIQFA